MGSRVLDLGFRFWVFVREVRFGALLLDVFNAGAAGGADSVCSDGSMGFGAEGWALSDSVTASAAARSAAREASSGDDGVEGGLEGDVWGALGIEAVVGAGIVLGSRGFVGSSA